jgi:ABC-type uncharacterized transport system permease subunit
MTRLGPAVGALLLALGICALVILLAGGDPWSALCALSEGAFGSPDGWSEVAVKTCPLLFTGLAVAVAFRTGVWNIGGEGQLLVGAIAMAWLGSRPIALLGRLELPIALGAAALAGGIWAGMAGLLKTRRGVNEIISTIMLNFVALGAVGYLVHGPLMEAAGRYPQTDPVVAAMRLSRFVHAYRVHTGLGIALAAALASYLLLFRSVLGYQLRAVGWNPEAARLAGIRIDRCIGISLFISGALCGLAGGIEVSAVTFRLYERFSPGYGFTAIAVALLGRLHPGGVVLAAVLFGALQAGSNSMQRVAGISSVLVSIIQATVIFSLIVFEQRATRRTVRTTG